MLFETFHHANAMTAISRLQALKSWMTLDHLEVKCSIACLSLRTPQVATLVTLAIMMIPSAPSAVTTRQPHCLAEFTLQLPALCTRLSDLGALVCQGGAIVSAD
eukprot:1159892-Pelagomonas_calceolata.AAC.17